jgi:hypothetical protein
MMEHKMSDRSDRSEYDANRHLQNPYYFHKGESVGPDSELESFKSDRSWLIFSIAISMCSAAICIALIIKACSS